jgi:hypothetical protein
MSAMPQRSIVDRMFGAAMLNVATYEEVEHDRGATGQAFVVVVLVAICAGIGSLGDGGRGMIGGVVAAIMGWLAWSSITMLVGTRLFGGNADWGQLLRTLGFAQSPGVLLILGIVPLLGNLASLVVSMWMLVAGVIAIRQALDIDTGKAVLTALVGWLAMMVLSILMRILF